MKQKKRYRKQINIGKSMKTIVMLVITMFFTGIYSFMPLNAADTISGDPTSRQVVGKLESENNGSTKDVNKATSEPSQKKEENNSDDGTSRQLVGKLENISEVLPDIGIYIDIPNGYFNDKATVTFSLKTKDGSMPSIKSVRARAGKKDKYTDVTDTMKLEITEDCTVHVIATDTSGRTYERSRKIACFDKEAPTLNASVSEGILEVVPKDNISGIKSVIISGYEYTDIKDGKLIIRLSQFDAGYEKFNIQAVDNAGNKSDVYKVKNPYYKSKDSDSDYNPAAELPRDTLPTDTSDSTAEVSEHIKVDQDGNVIVSGLDIEALLSGENIETQGLKENENAKDNANAEIAGNGNILGTGSINLSTIEEILGAFYNSGEDDTLVGREFYTITTKSGKIFYLIIDKSGSKETVRFLTDITENDLLHVVKSDTQSLPRNSAAKDSTIKDSALPNNNGNGNADTNTGDGYSDTRQMTDDEVQKVESEQQAAQEAGKNQEPSFIQKNMSYIIMAVAGVIAIALGYYFKVYKRRKNQDPDDTIDESEEEKNTEDTEEDYIGITKENDEEKENE